MVEDFVSVVNLTVQNMCSNMMDPISTVKYVCYVARSNPMTNHGNVKAVGTSFLSLGLDTMTPKQNAFNCKMNWNPPTLSLD